MKQVFICEGIRTPFGKYAGILSSIRVDDLAAMVIKQVIKKNSLEQNLSAIDEVILGNANQAGEDNRNIARMALLLADLPVTVPGVTINRLCASGLDAVTMAARIIKSDEAEIIIAGGAENMSRAPFVMPKAEFPFYRKAEIYDTTMGWRFVNKKMEEKHGIDSMPETAENVAKQFHINREDQDQFAFNSQIKTQKAIEQDFFKEEIMPISIPRKKKENLIITKDEHPRKDTTIEKLAKLPTPFKENGSVTAGNSSGINDGACAMIIASEKAIKKYHLRPLTRIICGATIGVEPRIMGMGPTEAVKKVLQKANLSLKDIITIELNEAFAAQSIAVLKSLNIKYLQEGPAINPNGGAIAIGHPLGASGARLALTLSRHLQLKKKKGNTKSYGIATMCVGVGQGSALLLEKV